MRSGPNFLRVVTEFRQSGTVFAVDRSTGEIKPMTCAQYEICNAAGLLRGYHVRLDNRGAEQTAAMVRAEISRRN